jgi:hypothetical protein
MKGVAELLLLLVTQLIDTTKIKKEDDCSDCLPTTRQTVYPGIGSDVADATETALPKLTFAAAWLHERLFDVPAVQVAL